MTHFLDEEVSIPNEMPTEAREFAYYTASIVESATLEYPEYVCCTDNNRTAGRGSRNIMGLW